MEQTELALRETISSAIAAAQNITVKSNDDYEMAGNARKELKYTIKKIADYWGPKVSQAFQMHKTLVAAQKDMSTPLEQADKIIDGKMMDYRREQDRIRREAEQERLRREAEARKAAEEAQRLIDEASRQEELDDTDVEILQMAQADITRTEMAVDAAPIAPPPVAMQGISVRKVWKARVIDDALVPVIVAGAMIRPVDITVLNKFAVASKGNMTIPGVEFYTEEFSQVRL